jgi:hypothetical protein
MENYCREDFRIVTHVSDSFSPQLNVGFNFQNVAAMSRVLSFYSLSTDELHQQQQQQHQVYFHPNLFNIKIYTHTHFQFSPPSESSSKKKRVYCCVEGWR